MKTLSILITLACALVTPSFAQKHMGLYLADRYASGPLDIQNLSIDVSIVGDRAISTLDFTFYNKVDHVLEGEFVFPLQNGQSVYSLALDIAGHLREAVVVEKNKGRESFETIVRRGVDPALLEQTAGNIYTTTIYPIPSRGTRRVVIGIEETLTKTKDGNQFRFPLNFSSMVGTFNLTISADGPTAPVARITSGNLPFRSSKLLHTTHLTRSQFRSGETLEVITPRGRSTSTQVKLERSQETGEVFFWGEFPVKSKASQARDNPKEILLIWDNSYSGLQRDNQGDKQLLLNYFKTLKNAKIKLVTFNLKASDVQEINITRGKVKALETMLDTMQYDGATRWKSLALGDIEADRVIIVSDGIGTLGDNAPTLPNVPTFVINSSIEADHVFLESLCQGTGGAYLNRRRIQDTDAGKALKQLSPHILSVKASAGEVTDLVYGTSQQSDTHLWIAGCLTSEEAELEIAAGTSPSSNKQYNLSLNRDSILEAKGAIRRAWARAVFSRMNLVGDENRKAASDFASGQKIVTPVTSLIVLETVEDYARFEIEPPKDLMRRYKRLIREKKSDDFDLEEKLEEVVEMWEDRIDWYESVFPIKAVAKIPPPTPNLNQTETLSLATRGSAPVPPTPTEQSDTAQNFSLGDDIQEPDLPQIHLGATGSRHYRVRETDDESDVFELNPFSISETENYGYMATSTLAGTRLRTNLRDTSASIQVNTSEFMEDRGYSEGPSGLAGKIALEDWSPNAEYFTKLQNAKDEDLIALYFELRDNHGHTPSFFFDVASICNKRGMHADAARILTSVLDLVPANYLYLRAVGKNLIQLGAHQSAVEALKATMLQRSFEPQSYFDLGLAYQTAGRNKEALKSFYHIIEMPTSDRFDEIEVIALMEINRILTLGSEDDISFIDKRLVYSMPLDLRVTLSWNTDDTDVDLHITNPDGEKCLYSNSLTRNGGMLSRDITEGYGPEEFLLKRSKVGSYKIQAHYFGSREQGSKLPVILSAQITRNYSRPNETFETITLRLTDENELVYLGEIVQTL